MKLKSRAQNYPNSGKLTLLMPSPPPPPPPPPLQNQFWARKPRVNENQLRLQWTILSRKDRTKNIKWNIFSLKKNTEAKRNKRQLHTSTWVSQVAQWYRICLPMQESRFDPCWKDPGRRKRQPTPVFLPGQSHGQSSLEGYSLPWGRKRVWYNLATKHINVAKTHYLQGLTSLPSQVQVQASPL